MREKSSRSANAIEKNARDFKRSHEKNKPWLKKISPISLSITLKTDAHKYIILQVFVYFNKIDMDKINSILVEALPQARTAQRRMEEFLHNSCLVLKQS